MNVVRFRKDYATKVMTALNVGLPIPAPQEGWTEDALMALAGAVHAELHRMPQHTWARAGAAAERHMRSAAPDAQEHADHGENIRHQRRARRSPDIVEMKEQQIRHAQA